MNDFNWETFFDSLIGDFFTELVKYVSYFFSAKWKTMICVLDKLFILNSLKSRNEFAEKYLFLVLYLFIVYKEWIE